MKYPEEILRERLLEAEAMNETLREQRDRYKEKFEFLVTDMIEDAWRIRNEVEQKFADFIEVLEDVECD